MPFVPAAQLSVQERDTAGVPKSSAEKRPSFRSSRRPRLRKKPRYSILQRSQKKTSQGVLHSCTSENLWCAEMERSRSEVDLACLHDLQLVPDSGREVHSESRGCPNSKAARGKKCRPEGAHCVMCEADLLRRQTIGYGFECLRMGLAAGFGTPGLPVRAENELRDPLPVRIVAGALSAYSRL